ncbi:hypothetical protein AYL99_12084 [Fonsecaea erecta]|uniref:N,N-dimethylformamidase beta subunit-like C-terminal domain-containing protein n=1 Tax=Fonsecaea erecta TaxID=1367422 RepID=A0A178Z2V5_9EURO|nr:hypothetical protein AYL99_12084 [Fonsecaea erecta]OAP53746.1 hypothetical protein AYL99_12084 [Fonsecaea erecta]
MPSSLRRAGGTHGRGDVSGEKDKPISLAGPTDFAFVQETGVKRRRLSLPGHRPKRLQKRGDSKPLPPRERPRAFSATASILSLSENESVAWIFENIGKDEILGEYGLGGGANGNEMDRFDIRNRSSETAKVLAYSTGHPDEFGIVPEDAPFSITNTLGTHNPLIRSDLTYYINGGGGGVSLVGSINWCCSLGWDDYKNNIATLTGNVINGFLKGR